MFVCSIQTINAQDEEIKTIQKETIKFFTLQIPDTSKSKWINGGIVSFSLAQSSLNNWAAGGDNFSASINTVLNTFLKYKSNKNSWDNLFNINFGYINSTSLGSRKNDDRFELISKYGRAINKKLNLAGIINVRSQFLKGYTYYGNKPTYVSNFFSPGYFLQSIGVDYKPNNEISFFISPLAARWVMVKDSALSNKGLYGVKPGKDFNLELGAYATLYFYKQLANNIVYKNKTDLFSNYKKNPQNIDLFMSNVLTIKISKYLHVNWNVDFIYDDDTRIFGPTKTSAALQMKSLVGIGIQFTK
jgi:hypothetical protein